MKRKSYILLVVQSLLRTPVHVRALAKELHTSQTTIARVLKQLSKENVVDYTVDGRNKTFFLKKSLETKQYILMAENVKLVHTLQIYPRLRGIVESLQKETRTPLILLFGSYAKETATNESDIDIYVETTNSNLKKELSLIDTKISIKIGRYNRNSTLMKEIEKNHVILKGVEHYYEINNFFTLTP